MSLLRVGLLDVVGKTLEIDQGLEKPFHQPLCPEAHKDVGGGSCKGLCFSSVPRNYGRVGIVGQVASFDRQVVFSPTSKGC